MAVAKDLFRRHDLGVAEVARRVGYGSASTFSTAFSRHVGKPPSHYARQLLGEADNAVRARRA
jgi:AraC-like DNA-binding protein